MIEVINLTKLYGSHTVVDGLSFAVRPGGVTGFLGPNGAGTREDRRPAMWPQRTVHTGVCLV